jgi:hypothetical protein
MHGKLAIALLAVAVFLPLSPAQQLRGPAISIPVPTSVSSSSGASSSLSLPLASARGLSVTFGERGAMRHFHRPPLVLATPYLYSDYPDSDYPAEPAVVEAPQPQVIVVQIPPNVAAAPKEAKPEPLLIEWQGDRYVRIGGAEGTTERGTRAPLDYVGAVTAKPTAKQAEASAPTLPAPVLPPVVLVYRDGRQEEIRDYTIADGVIYARGDYWTDGYWNKKIQLAALNLPATMKASQDHGVKFVLPAFPNEVVMRP